jgi:hypothetical protein
MFGEDTFTFEEANGIASFSPNIVKFYRDHEWLIRLDQPEGNTLWQITYMGARMAEIYMECKTDNESKNIKNNVF